MFDKNVLPTSVSSNKYHGMRIETHPYDHPSAIDVSLLGECKSADDLKTSICEIADDHSKLKIEGYQKFKVILSIFIFPI